jgi:hypothetical protein
VSRTASPFLNPGTNGNGATRPKSPLAGSESDSSQANPAASRAIPSSAIRKTTASGAPRKANVLGAKKTQKLGAKKIGGGDVVDFEAAEKKAKEEAERIAKLGYDPDAEEAAAESKTKTAAVTEKTKIVAPTPLSPTRASFGSTKGPDHSASDMERLGMGVGRLGFGQVGAAKTAAPAPKRMGFGSTGTSRAAQDGLSLPPVRMFRTNRPDQMTRRNMPGLSLALKKAYRPMNFSVVTTLIPTPKPRRNPDYKALKAQPRYPVMPTLVDQKMTFLKQTSMVITGILKVLREILSGSLELPPVTTWRI